MFFFQYFGSTPRSFRCKVLGNISRMCTQEYKEWIHFTHEVYQHLWLKMMLVSIYWRIRKEKPATGFEPTSFRLGPLDQLSTFPYGCFSLLLGSGVTSFGYLKKWLIFVFQFSVVEYLHSHCYYLHNHTHTQTQNALLYSCSLSVSLSLFLRHLLPLSQTRCTHTYLQAHTSHSCPYGSTNTTFFQARLQSNTITAALIRIHRLTITHTHTVFTCCSTLSHSHSLSIIHTQTHYIISLTILRHPQKQT